MREALQIRNGWQLARGVTLLGTLTDCTPYQPFFVCHFTPAPAFEEVASLFEEELRVSNTLDEDPEAWETTYEALLAHDLKLVSLHDGGIIEEFLLHISGDTAWFRY
jgi:hypothetical protein